MSLGGRAAPSGRAAQHVGVGGDRKTWHVPRDKDVDEQMIRDLRAMLADAQLVPPEVDR